MRLLPILVATLAACAADPVLAPRDCTPGQTAPCACPGASGVQVCDPDGALGACVCPDGGVVGVDVAAAQDRPAVDAATPEDRPAADVVTVRDVASSPDVVDAGVGRDVVQDAFVCEPRQTCGSTCVADYLTDPRNCGACFIRCPSEVAHSVPTCVGGRCTIGCEPGYVPCGVSRCSYALDPNYNCGACGGSCLNGLICERDARDARIGRCVDPIQLEPCPTLQTRCNGQCTRLSADVLNCGACGQVCIATEPNAVPLCEGASCVLHCADGWMDCNGRRDDGCEARRDVTDCSRCGNRCPRNYSCRGNRCTPDV